MKRSYLNICFLISTLVALLLTSCVDDTESFDIPKVTFSDITIKVSVPDTRTPSTSPSTRGMVGDGDANKEDEVKRVDLLVFDATDPANERFIEYAQGEEISQDFSQSTSTVTFTAKLSRRDNASRIVIVANSNIAAIAERFDKGQTTKAEVMEKLIHATSGSTPAEWKWKTDVLTPAYTPIPMYGEVEVANLKPQTVSKEGIELTRMLARIDIQNSTLDNGNTSNFTLEQVYLVNYNTAGYLAPAWASGTGQILDPQPDDPLIPAASGKKPGKDNAIVYALNGATEYIGEIYAYESIAAVDNPTSADGDNTSRRDAVCLVVKGTIEGGESSYYRVDFTAGSGNSAQYLPLKRNFKYVVDILQADGKGYASLEEAISSYTVLSNLKCRILSYDRSKIKNMVFNGQYMLGLGETEKTFDKVGTDYGRGAAAIDVFTDYASGWTATIPSDVAWLTFENGTKSMTGGSGESQMKFNVANAGTEADRTAEITVTAGRLTNKVTIKQTSSGIGYVKILDMYGNEVKNLFFPATAPITPQTVYVVWEGGENFQAELQESNTGNQGELINYDILDPMLSRTVATRLSGRIQAITIKPTPISSYSKWDWMRFYLFNENWSDHVSAALKIDQANMIFEISNLRTSGYTLGREYTLNLGSNFLWEIDNVSLVEGDNTLIADYKDIYVGNSGGVVNNYDVKELSFQTGKWQKGKKGILRISFKVTFKSDVDEFPFNRTIDIPLNSTWLDYTGGGNSSISPRYYLYPTPFIDANFNAITKTYAEAKTICENIGDGWRLPTMSELFTGYAYMDALGGFGTQYQNENGWFEGNHWSGSYIDGTNNYLIVQSQTGYGLKMANNQAAAFRCVYTDQNQSGTKYPYLKAHEDGVIIVSRDQSGGVDPSVLFSQGETPDETRTKNKVAPQLLIANSDASTAVSWTTAKSKCTEMGEGWRLPTQREAYLIWGLGGYTSSNSLIDSGQEAYDWSSFTNFNKVTDDNWTLTEEGTANAWLFQAGGQQMINVEKTTNSWVKTRCVKSLY